MKTDLVGVLIESLRENSVGIMDGWVPDTTLAGLRADILGQQVSKTFRPAGIGRGAAFHVEPGVRSDRLRWMYPETQTVAQCLLFATMEQLRIRLNRAFFLGLRHFEGHLTIYPPGASYQRHIDQFANHPHRIVSCVLFLNRFWSPERGGELRLFDQLPSVTTVQDVAPIWGRLVVFFSDAIPHEVLVTHKHRLSATGWFRDDDAVASSHSHNWA
jgi:SM-20-related protein